MTAAVRSTRPDDPHRSDERSVRNVQPGFWVRRLTGLYTLAAAGAARFASWWLRRLGRWTEEGVRQRRGDLLPPAPPSSPIWIHGASMGEARVGGYFAHALAERNAPTIASAMTEPGFRLCRDAYPGDTVCFRVPFDLPGPVHRVLSHFRPRALVLVETEWWPNLLRGAAAFGVPVFVINGRISRKAYRRYRLSAPYWRAVLRGVKFFYMRSAADAERLISLGVDRGRVAAAGLLKVLPPVRSSEMGRLDLPGADREVTPIWVAGCTRSGEEPIILEAFHTLQREFGSLCLWLAPRHPERFGEVVALVRRAGYQPVRWSEAQGPTSQKVGIPVVVIDEMGILAELYGWAAVAFVGGSLRPFGGHNPLEPALAGTMVVFGPYMEEQHEAAAMLLDAGLALQVQDAPSLAKAVAAVLRSRCEAEVRQARADELRGRLLCVRNHVADDLIARLKVLDSGGMG
jgi:3-deoxy-D-manno-octulosonic-acid transferase